MSTAERGPGHTAISLNNLALIYEKMGRWQEAEPTYKRGAFSYRSLERRSRSPG